MEYLFYYVPPGPNGEWMNVNKVHNIAVAT